MELTPDKLAELRRLYNAARKGSWTPSRQAQYEEAMHNALPALLDAATPKPAPVCCDPDAPVIPCANCGKPVHTCEDDGNVCRAHPDGCETVNGWVCSPECEDALDTKPTPAPLPGEVEEAMRYVTDALRFEVDRTLSEDTFMAAVQTRIKRFAKPVRTILAALSALQAQAGEADAAAHSANAALEEQCKQLRAEEQAVRDLQAQVAALERECEELREEMYSANSMERAYDDLLVETIARAESAEARVKEVEAAPDLKALAKILRSIKQGFGLSHMEARILADAVVAQHKALGEMCDNEEWWDERVSTAEARLQRIVEWMRGRCECCGHLRIGEYEALKECAYGYTEFGCGDWTPPKELEV